MTRPPSPADAERSAQQEAAYVDMGDPAAVRRISVTAIRDRAIEFLEDLPEPRVILYGLPIYDIAVRIEDHTYTLELYHGCLVRKLKAAGPLKGREAMIQLPEQEGAEWGARVFA